MIEVAYLTSEAFVLAGIVNSEDRGKRRVVAKQAGFRGHRELLGSTIFN